MKMEEVNKRLLISTIHEYTSDYIDSIYFYKSWVHISINIKWNNNVSILLLDSKVCENVFWSKLVFLQININWETIKN